MLQNHTEEQIGAEAEREELFRTLEDLFHQSRQMLGDGRVTLEDARALAGYVTGVRQLLGELVQIEGRMNLDAKTVESIACLKERYWELEGMVKEARNALDRRNLST